MHERIGEAIDRDLAGTVPANRDGGAVDGDRSDHGADACPVGQTGIDDRRGSVETFAERSEHTFEHHIDRPVGQVGDPLWGVAAIDPHLAAPVHHDLIDQRIAEVFVEPVEPVEARRRTGDRQPAKLGVGERSQPVDLVGHDLIDLTVNRTGQLAHPVDEPIEGFVPGHAAAARIW